MPDRSFLALRIYEASDVQKVVVARQVLSDFQNTRT